MLDSLESELFGVEPAQLNDPKFEVDRTFQGEEALARVAKSLAEGRPYSLAFIDMRMPPGWDGMRTIEEILDIDPELPLVTCTAFSDYTPEQVVERIGLTEGYLFIRKPFEPTDIRRIVDRMARVMAA